MEALTRLVTPVPVIPVPPVFELQAAVTIPDGDAILAGWREVGEIGGGGSTKLAEMSSDTA